MKILSDRQSHSGESLGQQLQVSRAAIWKQIKSLQDDGLLIESIHGKGYRLQSQIELLDEKSILSLLPDKHQQQTQLIICDELESTNQYLIKALPEIDANLIPVCLAEKQTAGRGRRGRTWQTPYASAIAMSLRWRFEIGAAGLAGLSLAVGVAVSRALQSNGLPNAKLKWPNDLVCNDKKLAGVLIEVVGDAAGPCEAVIGIGLNISNSTLHAAAGMQKVDQAWTDIVTEIVGPQAVSRNRLASSLISELYEMLAIFEQQGFATYRAEFEQHDVLNGREVEAKRHGEKINGLACGVNEAGELLLRTHNEVTAINSGDVSVRTKANQ